jgi:hypothetical protein
MGKRGKGRTPGGEFVPLAKVRLEDPRTPDRVTHQGRSDRSLAERLRTMCEVGPAEPLAGAIGSLCRAGYPSGDDCLRHRRWRGSAPTRRSKWTGTAVKVLGRG